MVKGRGEDVTGSYNVDVGVPLACLSGITKESVEEVRVSKDINDEQARQVHEILVC